MSPKKENAIVKVFVAGATGQTGRRIVEELVRRNISTRAFVRDADSAREILPPEAEIVVGDVTQLASCQEAIAGCKVLLCATGARPSFDFTGPLRVDYFGTKNLIEAAKTNNIEHFVLVSSLCVSQLFHPLNLFWLVLFWKKQAEDDLQKSGLTYTIVRPGGLRNQDSSDRIVMSGADTLFEGSIPRHKVALTCIEALSQPDARNKIVEIVARETADDLSFAELFASVG